MNNLKQLTFIIAIMAIVFTACGQKEFVTTETGLEYLKVEEGSGERPNNGDFVLMNIAYYDEHDNKIFSSVDSGEPIPLNYVDSIFTNNGSLEEGFKLCGKGDSLILKIKAKTLFEESFKRPLPDTLNADGLISIYLGVDNILTQEEFQAFRMERAEKAREKAELASKEQLQKDIETIDAYLKDNGIDAETTEEGLRYVITTPGNNEKPATGNTVVVNYTGKLLDGTMFDSSVEEDAKEGGVYREGRDYGIPFEFPLGQGRVIKGWDLGIALLSKGTKATLYIPSSLGYGARGAGASIGPNSILVFDVELIDFK